MQEDVKRCGGCRATKNRSAFSIDRKRRDGLQGKCRACAAAYRRKNADSIRLRRAVWVSKNVEKITGSNAAYRIAHRAETVEVNGRYLKDNKEAVAANKARYKRENSEKIRAHSAVSRAIRKGVLSRPTSCSKCDAIGAVDGHHPDYDRPLHVIWLCSSCHRKHHVAALRAEDQ